ncbi:hypothetical protein TNCV_170171 [Trichonephila clavipes]|nr:hypothetical protein TNCV_170171 [Trichonephila clavipes]
MHIKSVNLSVILKVLMLEWILRMQIHVQISFDRSLELRQPRVKPDFYLQKLQVFNQPKLFSDHISKNDLMDLIWPRARSEGLETATMSFSKSDKLRKP